MMEAVKSGVGRETAHHAIKEHAVSTVNALRNGEVDENDLMQRLASDSRLGMDAAKLQEILDSGRTKIGAAIEQVGMFVDSVSSYESTYAEAAGYTPAGIL